MRGFLPEFIAKAAGLGYDAVMLIAAAIKQAGGTEGPKLQQALESLGKVQGIIKAYDKPFSKEQHEALGVADFHLAQWKDGRVVKLDDAVVKGLTAADLKR